MVAFITGGIARLAGTSCHLVKQYGMEVLIYTVLPPPNVFSDWKQIFPKYALKTSLLDKVLSRGEVVQRATYGRGL